MKLPDKLQQLIDERHLTLSIDWQELVSRSTGETLQMPRLQLTGFDGPVDRATARLLKRHGFAYSAASKSFKCGRLIS